MSVKSSKNKVISERFRVAFKSYIEKSGKKKIEIADDLSLNTGTLSNILKSGASSAMMEEIADKLGVDLLDMLQEGRAILAGEASVVSSSTPKTPEGKDAIIKALGVALAAKDELIAAQRETIEWYKKKASDLEHEIGD